MKTQKYPQKSHKATILQQTPSMPPSTTKYSNATDTNKSNQSSKPKHLSTHTNIKYHLILPIYMIIHNTSSMVIRSNLMNVEPPHSMKKTLTSIILLGKTHNIWMHIHVNNYKTTLIQSHGAENYSTHYRIATDMVI